MLQIMDNEFKNIIPFGVDATFITFNSPPKMFVPKTLFGNECSVKISEKLYPTSFQ